MRNAVQTVMRHELMIQIWCLAKLCIVPLALELTSLLTDSFLASLPGASKQHGTEKK